jgi:competence protein ComEC
VKESPLEQLSAAPLLWISSAFLGGIILAGLVALPWFLWLGLAAAAAILAGLYKLLRPQAALALALLPAFLSLGGMRHALAQPVIDESFLAYYNDLEQNIYVTGTLDAPPDVRDTYMNLRIKATAVDIGDGDIPVYGDLLVRLTNDYDLAYGDYIRVRGQLETPPENEEFSYRDYLAMKGIHSILSTQDVTTLPFGPQPNPFWVLMYRLKAALLDEINQLFPQPESSLLAGVLLGVESGIPESIQQAFKNTGTAHIVAISGFNIAIIAAIFVSLFSRIFGRRIGALLAVLGIGFYTLLVGADASVVRAAIMGTFSILAGQVGRRNLALNTLAAVAASMAFVNPLILGDVGFQLSFMATLGLVLYAQPMQDWVKAQLSRVLPSTTVETLIGPLSDYFLLTFAAQLTTLPVTVYHFGRLSLVSFIANPFILPAQPPLMILGGLAAVLGRIYQPLGQVVAWVAWPFPAYTIRMVEFFNGFPGGVVDLGDFSLLATLLLYSILFGLTLFWSRLWSRRSLLTPSLAIFLLAILSVLTWRSALNGPDGRMHVTFLDVGSANAVLVKTPGGHFVLINGGGSPSRLGDALGRRIPAFRHKLDTLVIAAPQENQIAALPRVLVQYPPENVLWAGNKQASYSAGLLDEWLTTSSIPVTDAESGNLLGLGNGATLKVLSVTPRGAILSIEWGSFRAILPVGVTFDSFTELQNGEGLGPATVLLLAESGYSPSNPPEWIANIDPQVVILSVAADDPDGLPSPELLEGLEDANLLRTDVNGWIDLTTDGQEVWISVERK